MTYVSGLREIKMKRPDASVSVVDDCEGLVAVTCTSAIGLPVFVSVTKPLSLPVVPASAAGLRMPPISAKIVSDGTKARIACEKIRIAALREPFAFRVSLSIKTEGHSRYPGFPLFTPLH